MRPLEFVMTNRHSKFKKIAIFLVYLQSKYLETLLQDFEIKSFFYILYFVISLQYWSTTRKKLFKISKKQENETLKKPHNWGQFLIELKHLKCIN